MSQQPVEAALLQFDLHDRLRKSLQVADVSVQEMADYLEVSRTTVSRWINGGMEPKRPFLIMWAMRTGVPLSWLVTGRVKNETPSPDGEGVPDGASYQNRTDDLFITSETLYRLS